MYPLLDAILSFIAVTSVVWLPLLALSLLSTKLVSLLGRRATLCMGAIGVPLHELSHAAMALLMNHKIVGISLFQPNADGSLGYVNHAYRKTFFSPFALLLIALAPLLGAYIATYCVTLVLRPDLLETLSVFDFYIKDWHGLIAVMNFLISSLNASDKVFNTVAWIVCVSSIALFSVPSRADFQHCKSGIVALLALFVVSAQLFQSSFDNWVAVISGSLMVLVWPLYLSLFILFVLLTLSMILGAVKMLYQKKSRNQSKSYKI